MVSTAELIGREVLEQRHRVHDDRVDSAQLLGKHDANDGDDRWPAQRVADDLGESQMGFLRSQAGSRG